MCFMPLVDSFISMYDIWYLCTKPRPTEKYLVAMTLTQQEVSHFKFVAFLVDLHTLYLLYCAPLLQPILAGSPSDLNRTFLLVCRLNKRIHLK